MRIKKEDSLIIFIDVQEKLMPHIYKNKKLKENLTKFVKGIKVLGVDIIVTEQYKKGLKDTIEPFKTILKDDPHFEKTSFSCLYDEEILKYIKESKKTNIILVGIESHVCVLQTVVDVASVGLIPIIVEDCVSSRNKNDKEVAIYRAIAEGALITTVESLLFELCQTSKADEFKAISNIVK